MNNDNGPSIVIKMSEDVVWYDYSNTHNLYALIPNNQQNIDTKICLFTKDIKTAIKLSLMGCTGHGNRTNKLLLNFKDTEVIKAIND